MAQVLENMMEDFSAKQQAIGCMAHTIHLAAHEELKSLGDGRASMTTQEEHEDDHPMLIANIVNCPDGADLNYNTIITQIGNLAFYLGHSPQRRDKFSALVNFIYNEQTPRSAMTLLSHVFTRWNSNYEMIQQEINLKEAYNQFCIPKNMQSYYLYQLEWEKVQVMVEFLQPFYEANIITCGSHYPKINQALPLYILLIKRINQACNRYNLGPIEPAAMAMISKIMKYVTILLLKTPEICATIQDLRIKMKFFTTNKLTIMQIGKSSNKIQALFEEDAKNHFKSKNLAQDPYGIEKVTGLFDELHPSCSWESCTLETEIRRLLAGPPEPKDTNILIFWKSQGNIFPTLSLMACKYLAIPETSSPSEKVFSGGRKILTYQQSSPSSARIEQLACVKNWAHKFGQLYNQV
ncbi:hypothetical protein O181_033896 [Austropuccinia psidii MF-1]|uniref:HAT C-terminal dimerisation domain-containing protein n=1 Tax=Austropuccinia psidii MF-1 TaxID=1389203 RepID=A0A9Q3D5B0_9BASI|nr:hypothetical protein [Austropuccinia psidii MF-1]